MRASCRALAALALASLPGAGCSGGHHNVLVPNQRPVLVVTAASSEFGSPLYRAHLAWQASDPEGGVPSVEFAVDPSAQGDTAWSTAHVDAATFTFPDTLPPAGSVPPGSPAAYGYHTVALRAVDGHGLSSPVEARSFTPTTVAPFTMIRSPVPLGAAPASVPDSFHVHWLGVDPDAALGQGPARWAWRLVAADSIAAGGALTPSAVQVFFAGDAAGRFAAWPALPGAADSLVLSGLVPGRSYALALVAFDAAGAFEPTFGLDSNVLWLRVAGGP